MIKKLRIKNFTVFRDAEFNFSPGLNAVIGENGTGKSHLLKLGYSISSLVREVKRRDGKRMPRDKDWFQRAMANKLIGVFKPETLGRLRGLGSGGSKAEISCTLGASRLFADHSDTLSFSFSSRSWKAVRLENSNGALPDFDPLPGKAPLFFPPSEVLTFYPGFLKLYEDRELMMDETYYDFCKALTGNLLKGDKASQVRRLIKPLEEVMGGSIHVSSGRFILRIPGQGSMEIPLVAEGLRKIATLAYLILNGSLSPGVTLFWDEPETNLNPKLMVRIAETLVALTKVGVQVILSTHGLFLMKELDRLVESFNEENPGKPLPMNFFSLKITDGGVEVERGEKLEDLQTIVSLDEELAQDDREQAFFYKGLQP